MEESAQNCRFLSLLVSSQFLKIGLKTSWRRFLILSISTITIQDNLAIHRTVGSLWIFRKTHEHVFQSYIHIASLPLLSSPCFLVVSEKLQSHSNPNITVPFSRKNRVLADLLCAPHQDLHPFLSKAGSQSLASLICSCVV